MGFRIQARAPPNPKFSFIRVGPQRLEFDLTKIISSQGSIQIMKKETKKQQQTMKNIILKAPKIKNFSL